MKSIMKRLTCWWFGCIPDYDATYYEVNSGWSNIVPCKRCGAHDTDYADRVGDTRHLRVTTWMNYWLLRRWWPHQCFCCGGRFRHAEKCDPIPF